MATQIVFSPMSTYSPVSPITDPPSPSYSPRPYVDEYEPTSPPYIPTPHNHYSPSECEPSSPPYVPFTLIEIKLTPYGNYFTRSFFFICLTKK